MEKRKLTILFVDTNRPEDVEKVLRCILVEKLQKAQRQGGA